MNWKKALPDAASEDWAYATEIKGNIKLTPFKVNKIVKPVKFYHHIRKTSRQNRLFLNFMFRVNF